MKFDMNAAWSNCVSMLMANREVMLVLAGVFFFLPSVALLMAIPAVEPPQTSDPAEMVNFMIEFYGQNFVPMFMVSLIQNVGLLALVALLTDAARPTVGEAIAVGLRGLLPYIGTALILGIGLCLAAVVLVGVPAAALGTSVAAVGGIVCVVLLVYVMVKLSLIIPVIAIEKLSNPVAIMRRSWSLTRGNSARLLGFYLLLGLVFLVIVSLVSMTLVFLLALVGVGSDMLPVAGVIDGLLSAVASMVGAALMAAIHRQLAGHQPGGGFNQTFD